jgi:hypothetical protein
MPFPVDLKYIVELENDLGLKFPDIFKDKMIQENGGEIQTDNDEWILFPFFDKSDNKRISRTCNHIGLETKNAKEWDNFPVDAIAIGQNGFGDLLILLPNKNYKDRLDDNVYIWFHETGEIIELANNINLI